MVSAYGKDGFVVNGISENDYNGGGGGDSGFVAGGKTKHGGVGGKASKSHNAKEMKVANRRRNEKLEREEKKESDTLKANWVAAETKKWQPVDRADAQNQKRIQ